jgi:alkyl hydroperoxide reductase subunit AhpC
VDLENDPEWIALDVAFVSIAFDPADVQEAARTEFGIGDTPMLVDADGAVSADYDVLQWAVATGEPGHTFVLVDADGEVAWIRDYGVLESSMYVPTTELVEQVSEALSG